MVWTAEAIEDLKRLALEGRSASVIAQELGVGSRNAVIGKANRIGIKLTGGGRASASGGAPAGGRRAQWARVRRPWLCGDREDGQGASPFGDAGLGEMERVRFEDIREFACRWPLGDPRSREFVYCGLAPVEGRSYCPGHCRMAYQPPNGGARRGPGERRGPRPLASPWRLL